MSDVEVGLHGYYSVLGLSNQATENEIRCAYRKLAMKWHPDRWLKDPEVAGEAKRRFQEIQEAYSVLSDKGKRTIYDAGLFGLLEDDDDEGFIDFMQEMILMMQSVRTPQEVNSLEDQERLLMDMMGEDEMVKFGFDSNTSESPSKSKRAGVL
ncbi:uncharacterized protein LOC132172607 isoform X1 [Corylus avellana]|uniref:uncharacterized protein LOC132172607 isoform X1 n=1 Tax=Corylus avellana TaxID=13451 RepID=UPI001E23102C|nr:uncharacterized protein LOC132172607 isoform X1 [Corylus avellana]